jgi:threonine/homoserine/homoserine lactone efflux protein
MEETMEWSLLIGFALIATTLLIVPGPDWAFLLAAGSRDTVIAIPLLGILAGYGAITLAVVVGAGAFIASYPVVLTVLTLIGTFYLSYLGISILVSSFRPLYPDSTKPPSAPKGGYFLRGMAVSGLNPKGLLLYLAILPQFVTKEGWPVWLQFLVLGLVFIALTGMLYLILGLVARNVLSSNPRVTRYTSRVAGCSMIVVGLILLVERLVAVHFV